MSAYMSVTIEYESGPDVTDELGCSDTHVAGYRLHVGNTAFLDQQQEQCIVPVRGRCTVGESSLEPGHIMRLPPGISGTIRAETELTCVVVSVSVADNGTRKTVDLDNVAFEEPATSAVETAFLTAPLGLRGMKVNARRLRPGQHVPYHIEGDQEELFIPIRGQAAMRIDGTHVETPIGTVTRVAPPIPRSAENPGESTALWVMVGAPPTGGPREWDPGAKNVD